MKYIDTLNKRLKHYDIEITGKHDFKIPEFIKHWVIKRKVSNETMNGSIFYYYYKYKGNKIYGKFLENAQILVTTLGAILIFGLMVLILAHWFTDLYFSYYLISLEITFFISVVWIHLYFCYGQIAEKISSINYDLKILQSYIRGELHHHYEENGKLYTLCSRLRHDFSNPEKHEITEDCIRHLWLISANLNMDLDFEIEQVAKKANIDLFKKKF